MPRRKIILGDADDHNQLIEYVETLAQKCQSKALERLLRDHPQHSQNLELKADSKTFASQLDIFRRKSAVAIHLRGEASETPCLNCADGGGFSTQCVTLDGYDSLTMGCCSNCLWDHKTIPLYGRVCNFKNSK
jgi:hypothetical protein